MQRGSEHKFNFILFLNVSTKEDGDCKPPQSYDWSIQYTTLSGGDLLVVNGLIPAPAACCIRTTTLKISFLLLNVAI